MIENKSGGILPTDASASSDEVITLTTTEAGHVTTIRQTRAEHASDLAQKLARQAKGYYTVCEAAEIFSAANSSGAANFRINRLRPAIASRKLASLDPEDKGPVGDRLCRDTDDWLTTVNINNWIKANNLYYRWPIPMAESITDGARSMPHTASTWILKRPIRNDGFAFALHSILKAAFDAGLTRPNPREVLEALRNIKRTDVHEVLSDEVTFFGRNGILKTSNLEDIRKRIDRMTAP